MKGGPPFIRVFSHRPRARTRRSKPGPKFPKWRKWKTAVWSSSIRNADMRVMLVLAEHEFFKGLLALLTSVFEDWHRELLPAIFLVRGGVLARPGRWTDRSRELRHAGNPGQDKKPDDQKNDEQNYAFHQCNYTPLACSSGLWKACHVQMEDRSRPTLPFFAYTFSHAFACPGD